MAELIYPERPLAEQNAAFAVVLIGFQQQENLGLGYLASTLRSHGFAVTVVDFEDPAEEILDVVLRERPIIVGFSLIFQFYVHRFAALAQYLRDGGVSCHFTIGGHFPSLSYEETFKLAPQIDSVVRFEGELTLAELAQTIASETGWRGVEGLAYRDGATIVANPLRPLLRDLDRLPYPERPPQPNMALGHYMAPLLASRGCARTCSFCSIHVFYRSAPGKVVRTRRPEEVVKEMSRLYEERRITIFLFQDDDFPLFGPVWKRWTRDFLRALRESGLVGKMIWKISCRADAVDEELFLEMRDAGLYLVYMGLESGSEDGLDTLHKQITVDQNKRAVDVLKRIGVGFEFGFMMFDPSTTLASIRDNLHFLRAICGDGFTAVSFCRMLPYDGAPIKDTLAREGRLRGDVCDPDYDFLTREVSDVFGVLTRLLERVGWIHGAPGLSPQLKFAANEAEIMQRLFPSVPGLAQYRTALRRITAATNVMLFDVVEDVADAVVQKRNVAWTEEKLRATVATFLAEFMKERDGFVGRNQEHFLKALRERDFRLTRAIECV